MTTPATSGGTVAATSGCLAAPPPRLGSTRIERVQAHQDVRGAVFEPLDDAQLRAQRNVHVVITQPGAVRGNHWHVAATEVTSVVGPCLVRLKEDGRLYDLAVPEGEVWRFVIPPGVVHAFRNDGGAPMLLVSFSSEVHDPGGAGLRRETIL
jgi:dTDP-4-dehydrorhamnose 3,5-epimerase-like enzyme